MEYGLEFKGNDDNSYDFKIAQSIICGKWKNIILWNLHIYEDIRFSEFKKAIPDITTKMLCQELKFFCNHGILKKTVHSCIPPIVVYSLTEKGKSLVPILVAMDEWGKANRDILENENEE